MKNNMTEMVFILDRSGSMSGLEKDTIGGFNSLIAKQRGMEGEALVSLVLFNASSDVVIDRKKLADVPNLDDKVYKTAGYTALLDAVCGAIRHIGTIHKYARPEDVPDSTLFVIVTDGMENASCRYSAQEIRGMIERQKEKYGWEFLFLGANIDAVETAAHYGIGADRAVNYHADSLGTAVNYEALEHAARAVRAGAPLTSAWKDKVEKDYMRRKR